MKETFFKFHLELKGFKFYIGDNKVDIWELYWSGYDSNTILSGQTLVQVL